MTDLPSLSLAPDQLASLAPLLPKIFLDKQTLDHPITDIQLQSLVTIFSSNLDALFLKDILAALPLSDRKRLLFLIPPHIIHDLKSHLPEFSYLFFDTPVFSSDTTNSSDHPDEQEQTLYLNALCDDILNPTLSLSAFLKQYALLPPFPSDTLLNFGNYFTKSFYDTLPPLKSAESFGITLKYFYLLSSYVGLFPELSKSLEKPLSGFIMEFKLFPSTEWMVKVLDQLPPYLLEIIFDMLYDYESVRAFEKRHFYCKLLQELSVYLDEHPDYSGPLVDHL